MQISLATNKDVNALFFIWKRCFTEDSVFLNFFFKECFPLSRTYVYREGDIIVSSATILPINYMGEEEKKGAYLYGVCTLPEYRGRGLSISLIEELEEDCRTRGYAFILTRPATPSLFALYRKIGYSIPIYRQYVDLPLNIFADGVSYSELTAQRLKPLRNKYLNKNYFEWGDNMLDYTIAFYRSIKGSAVELESERYMIGYPDSEDKELYHILEMGNYNGSTLKFPTFHLVGNYIKAKHLDRTKARLYLPVEKHYSDLETPEREVHVLCKPFLDDIPTNAFFNFTLE